MTKATQPAMFDDPPPSVRRTPILPACRQEGQKGAWSPTILRRRPALHDRRPVCNRPAGHEGPHRYYDRTARVCAEWYG